MTNISETTSLSEGNPVRIPESVLAAARDAFDAQRQAEQRRQAAHESKAAKARAAVLTPFVASVAKRLEGSAAARLSIRWHAEGDGCSERVVVRGDVNLGAAGRVVISPSESVNVDVHAYPAFDDEWPPSLAGERVAPLERLDLAVLRVIGALLAAEPVPARTRPMPQPVASALPDDGGPAYPCDADDGLTKRDAFAIAAVAAIYAEDADNRDYGTVAVLAYGLADHLLAERSKPITEPKLAV